MSVVYQDLLQKQGGSIPRHGAADGNRTLTNVETVLLLELPATGLTTTITLPNVSECAGKIFSILVVVDGAGVGVVTGVNAYGTAYTSANLTALGDYVLIYSDGVKFHELKELTT